MLTYYVDRDCQSPLSICVVYSCTDVLRECMDPARLSGTIVGFPDPHIPLIASRVYRKRIHTKI